jgi:hypothetical protein
MIRGGSYERTIRLGSYTTQVREVGAIDESIRINVALWDMLGIFKKYKNA